MEKTTAGRYADDRSNAGAQVANHQQGGLGQSVSQAQPTVELAANLRPRLSGAR